jgi:F-type H+-transporting ATPase subunit delta
MNTADAKPREVFFADVTAQRVARVYAAALVKAADKAGAVDEVHDDLTALIENVFNTNPHLEEFLASSAIGKHEKARVLQHAFEHRTGAVFYNFLMVLNEHERLGLLRPVLTSLRAILDERARRIRVRVQTATPLPPDQRDALLHRLREGMRFEPVLEEQVDPSLLGGLVLHVGDLKYDASVRTRLETIRNQILEKGSHEIQSRRDRFSADG